MKGALVGVLVRSLRGRDIDAVACRRAKGRDFGKEMSARASICLEDRKRA